MLSIRVIFLLMFTAFAFISCTDDEAPSVNNGELAQETGTDAIEANIDVSECGGFDSYTEDRFTPLSDSEDEYYDRQVIVWSLDKASSMLTVTHKNLPLNCCGIHSVNVTKEEDTYVLEEIDEPDLNGDRCRCMCLFDFRAEFAIQETTTLNLEVSYQVTDQSSDFTTVYSGALDLEDGGGAILID